MSDKLLIEQLTEQVELQKTAEEAEFEKLAHVTATIDQAQTLVAVGEEMFKIAEELENENLKALAIDTYTLGERMGACLSKTASEDGSALLEALEIAEDMNKVASVYAGIADEAADEDFSKLAEAVIEVSNCLTDEANEVLSQLEEEEKIAEEEVVTEEVVTEVVKEATVKETANTLLSKLRALKGKAGEAAGAAKVKVETAAHEAKEKVKEHAGKVHEFAKEHKKAIGYSAAGAAGLAAAGYGAKKMHDKK